MDGVAGKRQEVRISTSKSIPQNYRGTWKCPWYHIKHLFVINLSSASVSVRLFSAYCCFEQGCCSSFKEKYAVCVINVPHHLMWSIELPVWGFPVEHDGPQDIWIWFSRRVRVQSLYSVTIQYVHGVPWVGKNSADYKRNLSGHFGNSPLKIVSHY